MGENRSARVSPSTTPPSPLSPLQQRPPSPMQTKAQESFAGQPAENIKDEAEMGANLPQSRLPRPANTRTPESRRVITLSNPRANVNPNSKTNGHTDLPNLAPISHIEPERSSTPDTPGTIKTVPSFDWHDLETRFERALVDANEHEHGLMAEFEELVEYFNVWTSAASAHDNERSAKRLQTRVQYVQIKEADLDKKKQYYEQVMLAFQNAMHLLNQA